MLAVYSHLKRNELQQHTGSNHINQELLTECQRHLQQQNAVKI